MADIVAEIKRIPPVTRFLVFSSLGFTVPVILNLLPGYKLVFITDLVLKKWELWRIYSSLFFGTLGLGYLFHLVMLYRSANSLEFTHYERRSSDFAWQLFLASFAIIGVNRPLGSVVHDHALVCCLTYLMCALSPPGAQTSVMGLVTMPIKYFPYALLALDVLSGRAIENLTGMIVGHIWWWSVWGAGTGAGSVEQGRYARFAVAPRWLKDFFGERREERRTDRDGYQVHAPRHVVQAAESRATGHNWGSGQRLGGQ